MLKRIAMIAVLLSAASTALAQDEGVNTEGGVSYQRKTVINFEDSLMGAGFQLDNPNVKRKCGCGASFDV